MLVIQRTTFQIIQFQKSKLMYKMNVRKRNQPHCNMYNVHCNHDEICSDEFCAVERLNEDRQQQSEGEASNRADFVFVDCNTEYQIEIDENQIIQVDSNKENNESDSPIFNVEDPLHIDDDSSQQINTCHSGKQNQQTYVIK